jgi:predicted SprT family Zn-dependent metalloprotease
MINIKMSYSAGYEIERIKQTLSKIKWYKESGYNLFFPKDYSLEDKNFLNEDYIKKTVLSEYNKNEYSDVEKTVNEQWSRFSPKLENYFKEASIRPENVYEIKLTKYGVGGSYYLPNTVIINFQKKFGIGVSKVIAHEIIHLSIQQWIVEYDVEHWEKERIVDSIILKIAPEISRMQNVPIDTKKIDKIFEKNYPNIKKIISNL